MKSILSQDFGSVKTALLLLFTDPLHKNFFVRVFYKCVQGKRIVTFFLCTVGIITEKTVRIKAVAYTHLLYSGRKKNPPPVQTGEKSFHRKNTGPYWRASKQKGAPSYAVCLQNIFTKSVQKLLRNADQLIMCAKPAAAQASKQKALCKKRKAEKLQHQRASL